MSTLQYHPRIIKLFTTKHNIDDKHLEYMYEQVLKFKMNLNHDFLEDYYDAKLDSDLNLIKIKEKMPRVRVWSDASGELGILTFDKKNDRFIFEYDKKSTGSLYGDIDIDMSRIFIKNTMFLLGYYSDGYTRRNHIKQYIVKNPESNESQWFFLTFDKKIGENGKGINFERLN